MTPRNLFPRALACLPVRALERLNESVRRALEIRCDGYFTGHMRPRGASQVMTFSDAVSDSGPVGIVIQGPLIGAADFTRETVKLYRRHFPAAHLIVSTWAGEPGEQVEALRSLGARVLLNPVPGIAGPANINKQLASSLAGIKEAQALGCRHVLKTRTDQRMFAPNALQFLAAMARRFPLQREGPQRERLIGCSLNTFKYRPYGVSDMLLYGRTEDMLLFWGAPFDERGPESRPEGPSVRDFVRWRACEVYLVAEFLARIGCAVEWTLAESYKVLGERFCIVDRESLDLYWPKYRDFSEYRDLRYDRIATDQPLTFRDWFLIHSGDISATADQERSLDLPFRAPVFHS